MWERNLVITEVRVLTWLRNSLRNRNSFGTISFFWSWPLVESQWVQHRFININELWRRIFVNLVKVKPSLLVACIHLCIMESLEPTGADTKLTLGECQKLTEIRMRRIRVLHNFSDVKLLTDFLIEARNQWFPLLWLVNIRSASITVSYRSALGPCASGVPLVPDN